MNPITHFDDSGVTRMADVGDKPVTRRMARATGRVRMQATTLELIRRGSVRKGDVMEVARLAAIMAAKRTWEWVPLCHPLPLDAVDVTFAFPDAENLLIEAVARATARTGVEMEALVAAATAALTVYDMCKSVDRAMIVEQIRLEEKSGGQSGQWVRSA
jgi:cyclic pyranopterin monophosphate synthase